MEPESRKTNHEKLFRYVTKYTASYWGTHFVSELVKLKRDDDESTIRRNSLVQRKLAAQSGVSSVDGSAIADD